MFVIILMFGIKVIHTVNSGVEAKRRTDKIAADVHELQRQNNELTYLKELYASDSQIESEYRDLDSKKKPGETIIIVSLPQDQKLVSVSAQQEAAPAPTQQPRLPNWQRWVDTIFN